MAVRGELIDDPDLLARHAEEWDALAVAAGKPYCAPGWMLPWWRHAAPQGARLRACAVREGDRLVGVGAFYVEPLRAPVVRYRPLATGTSSRIAPLAAAGREQEVAAAMAEALAAGRPRPTTITFAQLDPDSPWPRALARAWPGGPAKLDHRDDVPAPAVRLGDSFDDWLAAKSSNFRQQFRRAQRELEAMGAAYRIAATEEDARRGLREFARLHAARWEGRGESLVTEGVERMLDDVVGELALGERLRVVTLEVDGRAVSAQILVAAGGEVAYWNGGFDEAAARQRPALMTLVHCVRDGIERGDRRLDLGPGKQAYKDRLADVEDPLEIAVVTAPGALNRARAAPDRLRRAASERLSDDSKQRIRALLRRGAD
jgi:CelD/BcsL family acetyltransferase involved in cellulose biosynthesis